MPQLVSPAPTISEPPVMPSQDAAGVAADMNLHIAVRPLTSYRQHVRLGALTEPKLQSLAGLDIDRRSLETFASFYLPPDRPNGPQDDDELSSSNGAGYTTRRWTDLTVSLWQGDLTAVRDSESATTPRLG